MSKVKFVIETGLYAKLKEGLRAAAQAKAPRVEIQQESTRVHLMFAGKTETRLEYSIDASESPKSVREMVEKLVLGFPVPVSYNGEELSRPHALGNGASFVKSSIGEVGVAGSLQMARVEYVSAGQLTGRLSEYAIYADGLPVVGAAGGPDSKTIIHLAPWLSSRIRPWARPYELARYISDEVRYTVDGDGEMSLAEAL